MSLRKPNWTLKAVSDISFISDKSMSSCLGEPYKKNNEKIEELSHSVFKTERFELIRVHLPRFAVCCIGSN